MSFEETMDEAECCADDAEWIKNNDFNNDYIEGLNRIWQEIKKKKRRALNWTTAALAFCKTFMPILEKYMANRLPNIYEKFLKNT